VLAAGVVVTGSGVGDTVGVIGAIVGPVGVVGMLVGIVVAITVQVGEVWAIVGSRVVVGISTLQVIDIWETIWLASLEIDYLPYVHTSGLV
jgi:hypothetical protein